MPEVYHVPALLQETIEGLSIRPNGVYADVTFGGGGHSRAILSHLSPQGKLFGFDRDADARANAIDDPRFTFVHSNFAYLKNYLRLLEEPRVDGILADLGVSFHHFDDAERGFSFRSDAPLDMRMNRDWGPTAADLVNEATPEALEAMLRDNGDLKNARRYAQAIVKARAAAPILTTHDLTRAVEPVVDPRKEKKELAQVFQALRMEVNNEVGSLKRFLLHTPEILKPGGRLAILTYHSVEDRLVKNFLRSGNLDGHVEKDFYGNALTPWRLVTRQPLAPSAEEVERNPRSRSAKLRVAELIDPNPLNR